MNTIKTPQTSKLFTRVVDKKSGVPYYVLTTKAVEYQQGFYFVNESMTEDGRYLWFYATVNPVYNGRARHLGYIDFLTDEIVICYDVPFEGGAGPYVDVKTGEVYFCNGGSIYLRAPGKNEKARLLCTPKIEGAVMRLATHLTRTSDKKHFFLDAQCGTHKYVQGLVNIETGDFEKWTENDFYNTNHGQINPKNDRIALCAYDLSVNLDNGEKIRIPKNEKGEYERLWIVTAEGERRMYPAMHNYATHEWWNAKGDIFYYCCDNYGIYGIELATGKDVTILEGWDPWHSHSTADDNLFVFDEKKLERYGGKWYRGCPAAVNLLNRKTGKVAVIVSEMPDNGHTPENPNNYHIDPHPRFNSKERYIVFTTSELGGCDLAIAVVDEVLPFTE